MTTHEVGRMTRRRWLQVGGIGGLTLPTLLHADPTAARAKNVIVLFLSGGPSQLDMWDLKPDAPEEIRGTFQPIDTNVPGIRVGEHLPRLARHADKLCLLRAVHHRTTSHPSAAYEMMVGSPYLRSPADAARMSRADRPHPGSVLHYFMHDRRGMPASVLVPEAIQPNGPERAGQFAGMLGPSHDPFRINSDPNLDAYSPGAVAEIDGLPRRRMDDRWALWNALHDRSDTAAIGADFDQHYRSAFGLLVSDQVRSAFDINKETPVQRERYGRHVFGQSVLLARRLIEAGTRLVQVNWVRHDGGKGGQGYDSHSNHLDWSKSELLPPTDQAVAALLEDLAERGLLDETLVMITGEFGRTPRFNSNAGRDHWSACFSVVLAGGGIRGGLVHGASDKIAAYPAADAVTPAQIFATLFAQVGIDPQQTYLDLEGRSHRVVDADPIRRIQA